MSQNVPAGWYPDHSDASLLRYWDGSQWTAHTHPAQPQGDPSAAGQATAGAQHTGAPDQSPSEADRATTVRPDTASGGHQQAAGASADHQADPAAGYGQGAQHVPGYGQTSTPGYGQTPAPAYGQAPSAGYGQAPAPGYDQGSHPYAQQSGGSYGHAPGGAPTGAPGPGDRPKTKVGPIIAIVAGVVVLLGLLLFLGFRVFSSDGDAPDELPTPTVAAPDPIDEPTDEPEPDEPDAPDAGPAGSDATAVQDGGIFVAGDFLQGSVDTGGTWQATMTVEDDAMVVIDALTEDGQPDLTLELQDADGTTVTSLDDRHFGLTPLVGGSSLDPYVALWLEAGDYTLIIGTWMDAGQGDFELYTAPVSMVGSGHEEEITLEEDQYIGRGLNIEEAGEYTITATAENQDTAIALFDADGSDYVVEDPWESEAELTQDLEEGRYMVVIAEPTGIPDTFTFTVEGP